MIRVSPVGMGQLCVLIASSGAATTHISLIVATLRNVQCTIFMECIGFPMGSDAARQLEFGGFAEVKIADFHGRNDHFEGFFTGGAPGLAQLFNIA
jgi:hypothetical protein